jgi:hypothetical protein
MNLAEMLCYADIHQLNRIAKCYRCECNENSKNELIQSILYMILRRESFQVQIEMLEREDIQFIQSLIFDSRDVFSLEELMARAKQTLFEGNEERSPREMITNLTQKGWLFNGISYQTKTLFQIPVDVKRKIIETIKNRFEVNLNEEPEPAFYRDEQGLLREDLLTFLKFVSNNDLLLTSDGGIYKRQQQSLLDQMLVKEETIKHRGWRFGYGRRFKDYPDRFSFIYDYCYFLEYIKEEELRLVLTPTGQMKVAEGMLEEMTSIYRFWLRLYRGPIRNLQVLLRLLDLLGCRWVSLTSIKELLVPYIKKFYYDDANSIVEKRIIQMMFHIGLIKVGQSELGETVLKMTETGHRLINGIAVKDEEVIHLEDNPDDPVFKL